MKSKPRMRRSWLSVPALHTTDYKRLAAYDADVFGLDLEDSIARERKEEARRTLIHLAQECPLFLEKEFFVRINDVASPDFATDIEALLQLQDRLDGLVIPKVRSAADIQQVDSLLKGTDLEIVPLIETLAGEANLVSILSASPRIHTVHFAENADYSADLAFSPQPLDAMKDPLAQDLAIRVVKAAKVSGLEVMEGPYLDLQNEAGLRDRCRWAKGLGIAGKVAMHPKQIQTINEIFTADAEAIAAAREIVAAYEGRAPGQAVVSHGNTYILPPQYKLAKRFLEKCR